MKSPYKDEFKGVESLEEPGPYLHLANRISGQVKFSSRSLFSCQGLLEMPLSAIMGMNQPI